MRTVFAGTILATVAIGSVFAADDWYPSKYGAEDTIGAANNLTADTAKAGAAAVKTGKVYSLGIITDADSPAYPPRKFQIVVTQSNDGTGPVLGSNKAVANDDIIMTYVGIGSQIDGLGHLGIDHRYYNGNQAKDFVAPGGLRKLGTEGIPPIATRGILLDMTKQLGVSPVTEGRAFNKADIEAAEKAAGVTIGSGDVVLFHTGWMIMASSDKAKYIQVQPGLGKEGAEYLAAKGVVAIGADTAALEVIPFEVNTELFPVHQILLAKNGVYILENMNTSELAADGVTEFFFVLGQAKMRGAVQMMVNPIAIR